jgi:plastocyanin
MRSKVGRIVVMVLALSLVAAACSKKSNESSGTGASSGSSGSITIGSDKATNKGTQDISGKSTFELEMDNDNGKFYFKPTVLKGTAGQQLTLTLKNEGNTVHNFSLVGSEANGVDVQAGQEGSMQVTFPQSGFVEFFCKYHRSLGMVGELTV